MTRKQISRSALRRSRKPGASAERSTARANGSGPQRSAAKFGFDAASHPYFELLNAMSDGAALLDTDGAILFANETLASIVGMPHVELRRSAFPKFLTRSERPRFQALMQSATRAPAVGEFNLLVADHSSKPVRVALSALPLADRKHVTERPLGDGNALIAIVSDLTQAKAAEATRTALLGRLIAAEDDERRRIARELHDETGQSLTAMLVGLRIIAEMEVPPQVRPIALRLRDIVAQMVDDLARLARGLHPAVLDDKGLEAAASRYVSDYSQSFRIDVEFVSGALDVPPLPPVVAATAYRILQEALTNVARHANAKHIAVELKRELGFVEISVRDDGVGFDVPGTLAAARTLGLHGMRERVTLLGGTVEVESGKAEGTHVCARIPVTGGVPLLRDWIGG